VAIARGTTATGDVRYEVRLRGPDGRERSRTFRTRKAAETYERELLAQRDRGGWVDPRAGRISLADWVTEWSATLLNLRPSSRRIYLDNLRLHVLPELGDVQLAKLDKAMLRSWLARLSAGPLKPATVHQVYRALRRVLGAAVENDVIARSPLEGIKPPRLEAQEMRFLTPGEVAALTDAIDERYRAFVTVGAYCGLRLGEMAGLRRHRVDVLHRQLRVVEQLGRDETGRWALQPLKTRSSVRSIALPAVVAEGLEEHLHRWAGEGREGFVFAAPDGGQIDPDNFRSRIWTPAVGAAGLAPLRIHDLRHTTASFAIAAGADVKTLQAMLGHASAVMTLDRYGHLMPGRGEDVANRLDALARGATAEPIPAAVRLDARDFRGMDLEPTSRKSTKNAG
jgi:integrase